MVMSNASETLPSKVHCFGSLKNGKMSNSQEAGKNWKLMIDPFLVGKGTSKVVRSGDAEEIPTVLRDPRFGTIPKLRDLDLKLPQFKFDNWSVGSPPLRSVFVHGLNDNVDQEFLQCLFLPLGHIDQLKVYYHPKSHKHLGIAFVSFGVSSATREAVDKYNGTSIMGNVVSIVADPLCHITKKVLDKLIKNPNADILQIIHSKEAQTPHKTSASAFRHNDRSTQYYTARGKERRPSCSDNEARNKCDAKRRDPLGLREVPGEARDPLGLREVEGERSTIALDQVSPKLDTPPLTEISPIHPEEDMIVEEQFRCLDKPSRPKPDQSLSSRPIPDQSLSSRPKPGQSLSRPKPDQSLAERDLIVLKSHMSIEKEHRERDHDQRKGHSERKYEEWKMRTEMQIRTEKTNRYVKEHCGRGDKYPVEKYPPEKYPPEKYPPEKYPPEKYPPEKYPSDKYTLEKCASDKYASDKYASDKYKSEKYKSEKYTSDKYVRYRTEQERYYKEYYKDREYRHDDKHRSKYERSRYYEYRPSSKESRKIDYHRESPLDQISPLDSTRPIDQTVSPHERARSHVSPHERTRSHPPEERMSKRKLSKSPAHQTVPASTDKKQKSSPKPKVEPSCSAGSHDTGYNSISPLLGSPPKPEPLPLDMSSLADNPYGCARAVPRKHITAVKVVGLKAEDQLSSSSMSLDEEEPPDTGEDMQVEDISPNLTPAVAPPLLPTPPILPLPAPPVQYQAGQWLHTDYQEMYNYGYDYNCEEAADILARREAEEKAGAKRREQQLSKQRRSRSLHRLLLLMGDVLTKDIKIRLNERVAFARLEHVWNEEEDRKKREEEEQAAIRNTDPGSKAPDMPSLSEMRSASDAKQSSHIRQASLAFKVPKLNRGLIPQVIMKKMQLPRPEEEEEVSESELVPKTRALASRYNTIYSSSSDSISEEEEEEEKCSELSTPSPTAAVEDKGISEKYPSRLAEEDLLVLEQLFREDLSEEDKLFFKSAHDRLVTEDCGLLEGVRWLSPADIPRDSRRRLHSPDALRGGCARTYGFYRMSQQEKMAQYLGEPTPATTEPAKKVEGRQTARSTRAMQRRQATHYLDVPDVQFMQLTTRRKQVKFMRSGIHDWGLFALEPISADEMVIEYVGQVVREIIANVRETRYEKQGIGSSYLFRIEQTSYIVDATHRGNISRFINHNCDPNCYARVITVGTKKKIVIYSKREIEAREEITYDYKFAIEEDSKKIRCLCKSTHCRGFLN